MYDVSVIIPAYNAEATILNCLNSVINQTIKIHEVLVIDDGSTDKTFSIVQTFILNRDLKNFHLLHQPNSGPSVARNLGIEKSTGNFVAFLDSDDTWLPDKLNHQLEVFKRYGEKVGLVGCRTSHYKRELDDSEFLIDFKSLLWTNYFSTPTVIVRKELLLNNRFESKQKYSEDYGLWLRLAKNNGCIMINSRLVSLADKPVYGHSGLSSQLWQMEKGELKNYVDLFKSGKISLMQFYGICIFSLSKFVRRCIISFIRNKSSWN